MLRPSRTIASLIHALTLGTAATIGLGAVATVAIGCKDEGQPDYWVDKLDDTAWRPRAVKRLEQFFEDAITRANKDMQATEVKQLLDVIVEPLTKTYVENYDQLDTKTRVSLIKLLSAFEDKRIAPAIKKAFEEFAKRPKTSADEADIKWAARAMKNLKMPELAGPMLDAFQKMKTHSMLGGIVYRDLNEAMLAMPQQSWAGPLKQMLEVEIEPLGQKPDPGAVDEYKDQLFWQTTAAQLLGELGDPSAVEPLLKVMLDPTKADVQGTAVLALVKIGKPAADLAIKLLKGDLDKLEQHYVNRYKKATKSDKSPEGEPYKQVAALVLGTIGHAAAAEPMVKELEKTQDDSVKAVIARELTKLPPTAETKAAFKNTFESISAETIVPPGMNALQMLAESSTGFYEPDMVPWMSERASKAAGYGEDKKALQSALTVSMLKIGKADQLNLMKQAVKDYGTKLESDILELAEKQLKACGDRVSCYLAELEKSENQDQKNQFAGIKAGYMLGVLGNESTRGEIIERFDAMENPALRFVAAQAIDHLAPKGSVAEAAKLEAIVEKNARSGDRSKIQGDQPLKEVMYRIRSRAQ